MADVVLVGPVVGPRGPVFIGRGLDARPDQLAPEASASDSSPSSQRAPAPSCAAASAGLYSEHRRSDRQPQPMQLVSVSDMRCNSAIFASIFACQFRAALLHSDRVGARSSG